MKKIMQMLLVICVMVGAAQIGFAKDRTWSDENFDLSSVHRMLILEPNYSRFENGATSQDIMDMMYQEGVSSMYMMQKSDLERNILRDTGVDIGKLDAKQAEKAINDHMEKYVDAYVVATVVHNKRVVLFFDVYSAKTKRLVFTDQVVAGGSDPDTIATYAKLTKNFYKDIQKEAKEQLKKKNKK